jgi:hypothetical protein
MGDLIWIWLGFTLVAVIFICAWGGSWGLYGRKKEKEEHKK